MYIALASIKWFQDVSRWIGRGRRNFAESSFYGSSGPHHGGTLTGFARNHGTEAKPFWWKAHKQTQERFARSLQKLPESQWDLVSMSRNLRQATVCASIFEVFKKGSEFCIFASVWLKDTPAMVLQAIINEAAFAAFDWMPGSTCCDPAGTTVPWRILWLKAPSQIFGDICIFVHPWNEVTWRCKEVVSTFCFQVGRWRVPQIFLRIRIWISNTNPGTRHLSQPGIWILRKICGTRQSKLRKLKASLEI